MILIINIFSSEIFHAKIAMPFLYDSQPSFQWNGRRVPGVVTKINGRSGVDNLTASSFTKHQKHCPKKNRSALFSVCILPCFNLHSCKNARISITKWEFHWVEWFSGCLWNEFIQKSGHDCGVLRWEGGNGKVIKF